jgi:hypothetical protein
LDIKFRPEIGTLVVGFTVGIENSIVNNFLLGLIAGGAIRAARTKGLMANAVPIGVDLKPNLSHSLRIRCEVFVNVFEVAEKYAVV